MPGVIGRPTDYSDEIIEKSLDYLAHYKSKYNDEFPSAIGLSIVLGHVSSTIYKWKHDEDKIEFASILKSIMDKQHQVLLNKGVTGEFNSQITKLALGKHGYSEKHEHMGEGGGPIQSQYVITPVAPKQIEQGEEDIEDI